MLLLKKIGKEFQTMAEIKRYNGKRGISFKITVSYGRDANGKKLRATTTFKPTKKTENAQLKEAQVFAVKFEESILAGKAYDFKKISFKDFVCKWHDEWAISHLTQSQVEQYQSALNRVIIPAIGNKQLSKITALDCQSIVNKLVKEGKAPKTVRRYVTAMNSVLRFAYKMNLIEENPVNRIELPKLKKDKALHYFNNEQAKIFLAALNKEYKFTYEAHDCKREDGSIYHVDGYTAIHRLPLQLKVYFTIALYSGFRRGEMIGLDWSAVNFENHTITVKQAVARTKEGEVIKSPKTESGYRTLALPSHCFDLLKNWKNEESVYKASLSRNWQSSQDIENCPVFIQKNGQRMSLYTPGQAFDRILQFHNSDINKQIEAIQANSTLSESAQSVKIKFLKSQKLPVIRLHDLRHTSATLLIASGVDIETVSHRLGHSEASITLDIYGHPMPSQDDKASSVLGNLLG